MEGGAGQRPETAADSEAAAALEHEPPDARAGRGAEG